MTYTLVLLRHGESDWNAENLFTGWVDVDLSDKGRAEAVRGGEQLRDAGILPDVVHTSLLRRAITHRQPRARRRRPALDPGAPQLAPQRAPLRRAAGQGQEADARRSTARSSSCSGAARSTPRRRRSTTTTSSPRPHDLALRRPRRRAAPHRVPQGRHRPPAALLGRADRADDLRAGQTVLRRRPRQQPAGHRQAPRRHQRRRHRRPEHPHRHAAGLRPRRRPAAGQRGGEYLDPEAAEAAPPSPTRVADPGRRRPRGPADRADSTGERPHAGGRAGAPDPPSCGIRGVRRPPALRWRGPPPPRRRRRRPRRRCGCGARSTCG